MPIHIMRIYRLHFLFFLESSYPNVPLFGFSVSLIVYISDRLSRIWR